MQLTSAEEDFYAQYEPMEAEDRLRIDDTPVGLKNVGNSKLKD